MAMSKAKAKEAETEKKTEETEAGKPSTPAPSARRGPAGKEIIPMAWKLVGTSAGTPVTLLRCIERKDAEEQMERLKIEGYYSDLEIYPADEPVKLSAALEKAKKRVIQVAMGETESKKAALNKSSSSKKAAAAKKSDSNKSTKKAPATKKKAKAKSAPKSSKKSASAKKKKAAPKAKKSKVKKAARKK